MLPNLILIYWCNIYQFRSMFWAISYNVRLIIVFIKSYLTSWFHAVWSFSKSWALVWHLGSVASWLGWIASSHPTSGSIWSYRGAPIHHFRRIIKLQRTLKRQIPLHSAPHWRGRSPQAIIPYSLPDLQYL